MFSVGWEGGRTRSVGSVPAEAEKGSGRIDSVVCLHILSSKGRCEPFTSRKQTVAASTNVIRIGPQAAAWGQHGMLVEIISLLL